MLSRKKKGKIETTRKEGNSAKRKKGERDNLAAESSKKEKKAWKRFWRCKKRKLDSLWTLSGRREK